MVEPTRRQAEVLRQADRGVGTDRKARDRQPVDVLRAQPGLPRQRAQGAAYPPMRTVGRKSAVGNRDRRADRDAVIGFAIRHHMNSWMLPNAASQLTISTRFSLILRPPSITASVCVAQAA